MPVVLRRLVLRLLSRSPPERKRGGSKSPDCNQNGIRPQDSFAGYSARTERNQAADPSPLARMLACGWHVLIRRTHSTRTTMSAKDSDFITDNAAHGGCRAASCSVSLWTPEYTREYNRKYRQANRDKAREYAREYYRTNRDKICARTRELGQINKEKYAETKKVWRSKQDPKRLKNLNAAKAKRHRSKPEKRESLLATARKYKEANKDSLRKRQKEQVIEPASDTYIKHLMGYKGSDEIPNELITIKREHIKLRRALKNL